MNREIKFRGQRLHTKEWVVGYYNKALTPAVYGDITTIHRIQVTGIENYFVVPETVGQFTGLKDKNGGDIYEGDILKNTKGEIGKVVWEEAGFCLECERKNGDLFLIPLTIGFLKNKEISENIYSNPELLKNK